MTAPQDHKKKAPKPSEIVDAQIEQDELRKELLGDMPSLKPPQRFRLGDRARFDDLIFDAIKTGAFGDDTDGDEPGQMLEFDMTNPDDIERFQKFRRFIVSVDEWAESIAEDPAAYAQWSEGKSEETFTALFVVYREALGESGNSSN